MSSLQGDNADGTGGAADGATTGMGTGPETAALSPHPVFDAMIAEAKRTPPDELISSDDLDRQRPLTPGEIAAADAWLDDLERQEAEAPAAQVP
jgi:hypothetical protein